MDAKQLAKIVVVKNKTIDAERAALARGDWANYVAQLVPPPSRLKFGQYRDWREAYERALAIGAKSQQRKAIVFPVWYCSNESEDATTDWSAATVVLFDDESYDLFEKHLPGDAVVIASVEHTRLGFLAPSVHYAPDVRLPYRNDNFVTVESSRVDRVITIDREIAGTPVPKPTRQVAAFAVDAELAVILPADEPVAKRAAAATERLRVNPEA